MKKSLLTPEETVRLYVEEGLSTPEIAKVTGTYPSSVAAILKRRGINVTRRAPINRIETDGNIARIEVSRPQAGEIMYALVDAAMVPKLEELGRRWWATWHRTTRQYMVQANIPVEDHKWTRICLHRFVTDAADGADVDHRNHNMLDNRLENLRLCSRGQNLQNRQGAQCNSTTGLRGVYWDKGQQRWKSQIQVNGKSIHLGRHMTKDEAEQAAIRGRRRYMTHSPECEGEVMAHVP